MSDPQATQPAEPVPAPAPATETAKLAKRGTIAAICDALKVLFQKAPKVALGWICAGLAIFIVLCGVGIMWAFIMRGWPSMADKKIQNWEMVNEKSGKAVVELRTATEGGKIETSRIEVPEGVADPKDWATKRYGEQRPLKKLDLIPPESTTDTTPVAPITGDKP